MQVYAELVFLINFLVDFLLLYGTDLLSGFPASVRRAVRGAALGGVYAFACLLPGFSFLGNGLWRLISFGIVAFLAFGTGRSALRRGILFFLLSMALGGIAMGLGSGTVWTLVLAAAGLWLICLVGFGGREPGKQYLEVSITHQGRQIHMTALADTGNTLKDPISGLPVLVADAKAARQLLGLAEKQLADPMQTLARGTVPGLRLIPYHAVGTPGGFLLGFRPDKLLCNGKQVDMVVAFAPHLIGENQAFHALAGGMI